MRTRPRLVKIPESISFVWVSRGTNEPSPDWEAKQKEVSLDSLKPKHLLRKSIPWNGKIHGIRNIISIAQRNPRMQAYVYCDVPKGHELDFILTRPQEIPKNIRFVPVEELFEQVSTKLGDSPSGQKTMNDLKRIYRAELKYGQAAYAGNVIKIMALYQNGDFVSDMGVQCNQMVFRELRKREPDEGPIARGHGGAMLHCLRNQKEEVGTVLRALVSEYDWILNESLQEAMKREQLEETAEAFVKKAKPEDVKKILGPDAVMKPGLSWRKLARQLTPKLIKGWDENEGKVLDLIDKNTIEDNIKAANLCMEFLLSQKRLQDIAYMAALKGEDQEMSSEEKLKDEKGRFVSYNCHKESHLSELWKELLGGNNPLQLERAESWSNLNLTAREGVVVERYKQIPRLRSKEFDQKWKADIVKDEEKGQFLKRAHKNSDHDQWLGQRVIVLSKKTKDDSQTSHLYQESLSDWKKYAHRNRAKWQDREERAHKRCSQSTIEKGCQPDQPKRPELGGTHLL